jgi:hypothetical protein
VICRAKRDLVLTLVNAARTIINCTVLLTGVQLFSIARRVHDIKALVSLRMSNKAQKELLQKGSLVTALDDSFVKKTHTAYKDPKRKGALEGVCGLALAISDDRKKARRWV